MLDSLIIIAYFILVLWLGLKAGKKVTGIKSFAIGERNFSVPVLVAAYSATLIGGGATLGLTEKSFSVGIIFFLAYCGIFVERALTISFIADHMKQFFGLITAGDIMEKIYGKHAKIATGIATITTSVFILGAHITTMGFILNSFLGIPLNIGLMLSTISILLYSGYGGISSVTFTDVVQFVFMLVSIPLVAILALSDVGGLKGIASSVPESYLNIAALDSKIIWNHVIIFVSYSLPALYPVVIQRMLMAKNIRHIKLSLFFNAVLSIFFFLMTTIIGLTAFVKDPSLNPRDAFSFLVQEALPVGIKGLVVAGLLATIMSTVDSFLNLLGISFAHDVLQPISGSRLSSKTQLIVARITTFTVGIGGLISSLYFDGIFENIFASMNLWLPFIFPPLFFGIRGASRTPLSFTLGAVSAVLMLVIIKSVGYQNNFFATLAAASMNSVVLILSTRLQRRSGKEYFCKQVLLGAASKIWNVLLITFKSAFLLIRKDLPKTPKESEILSVFALTASTLPLLALAGAGDKSAPMTITLSVIISLLSTFFLLKELWIKTKIEYISQFLWPIFLVLSQIIQPIIDIAIQGFTPLSCISVFLGLMTLFILTSEAVAIFFLAIGVVTSAILASLTPFSFMSSDTLGKTFEIIIRLLILIYFVVSVRKRDSHIIKAYDTINSTMAHEIGHSIVSMNFYAKRMMDTIPTLLECYKIVRETEINHPKINPTNLKALSSLAKRLTENASRTKDTIQAIQTQIELDKANSIKPHQVRPIIKEALSSGVIQTILPECKITLEKFDFPILTKRGPVVHVFINIIKNALEAMMGQKNPGICIKSVPENKQILIANNGPIIPSKVKAKLFDSGFTTRTTGQGRGLFFCSFILNQTGGSITCESNKNETVFILNFK